MKTAVRLLPFCFASFALAAMGCSSLKSNEQAAQTSAQPAGGSSMTASTNPHDAVVAAMKRWITVKSFRQRFTTTSDGSISTGSMEFVAPDRVRFVMDIAGEPFESITIGPTEYSKDADGKWMKMNTEGQPGASLQGRFFADPRHVAELAGNISDAQYVGSETVEGTPTRVYRFKHKLSGTEGIYDSKLWVAITDGLPREFETAYDYMVEGVKRAGKSSGIYFDYNAEVEIKAPIP